MNKDLSIIIVNYNVSSFLKLCLYSVKRAMQSIDAEVFVVDNASSDSSVEMVKSAYPEVNLIENKENAGFAAGNNQAIAKATGRIILLLNPDTIVPEDTFQKLLAFYDEHPEAAGVGVKMIDGSGNYLPESKRGLPTPIASFYKFSGLIKLFPKSEKVAAYYVGQVPHDKTAQVPVLAGAFMAFPKEVLIQTEPLDESFFMYGEDIDFSYRLAQIGLNYYYHDISIIHFKGESAKKDRVYLDRFYDAMLIFAKKHFFPHYNFFHKWLVISSIKIIQWFFEILMIFKGGGKMQSTSSGSKAFFVGSLDGYDSIKNELGVLGIEFCKSFDSINISKIVSEFKPVIFIDLSFVSVKEAIDFMKNHPNKCTYTFLSPDRKFYLNSSSANSSGEITLL